MEISSKNFLSPFFLQFIKGFFFLVHLFRTAVCLYSRWKFRCNRIPKHFIVRKFFKSLCLSKQKPNSFIFLKKLLITSCSSHISFTFTNILQCNWLYIFCYGDFYGIHDQFVPFNYSVVWSLSSLKTSCPPFSSTAAFLAWFLLLNFSGVLWFSRFLHSWHEKFFTFEFCSVQCVFLFLVYVCGGDLDADL